MFTCAAALSQAVPAAMSQVVRWHMRTRLKTYKPDTPWGVWFESRQHVALAWFICFGRQNRWVVTVSSIPDRYANINPASRAQFWASSASRETVKSRIPSIHWSFFRFPCRILVKYRIPKIPFQTLCDCLFSGTIVSKRYSNFFRERLSFNYRRPDSFSHDPILNRAQLFEK